MKAEETNIFWLQMIARKVSLPLWCFVVAHKLREPIQYPAMDLEWFKEHKIYLGHLGAESEEYYALRKRLETLLLPVAIAAESMEEIDFVFKHLDSFDQDIREVVSAKRMKLSRPDYYKVHEKSLKSENARRLSLVELSETEAELWSLVSGVMAEPPRFDTATELAVKKMLQVTTKFSTLKWLYDSYLSTRPDQQFAVARRIVELESMRALEM